MTNLGIFINTIFIICVVLILIKDANAQLPSSITPCHHSDQNINACYLRETRKFLPEFVKGLPDFDIPSLDPLLFGDDEYSIGGVTSKSKDGVITGFKDCVVEDIKLDLKKKKIVAVTFGDFEVTSKYQLNGKLLSFPLNINGNLLLKIEKFRVKLILDWKDRKGKDGKTYFHITNFKRDLQFGNVRFNLTGLLNKQVDETMNAILNDNWRDVIAEVGGPAIDTVMKRLVEIVNKFISKIPSDVLIIND